MSGLNDSQKQDLRTFISALRSGSYDQCTEYLHLGGRFCAAGVACDTLFGETIWTVSEVDGAKIYYYGLYCSNVPEDLSQRLPINWDTVVEMNDLRCSFEEIASFLETEYLND